MFAKVLHFYTIIIIYYFRNASVRSISITSIVRFKCSSCKPDPSTCCIGTLILPNVVLTTSYCAEACQYVDKIPIKKVFIRPYSKNFVQSRNFVARNDIALVLIGFETRHKRKLVKLSALDKTSTLGYKALIPIMDDARPRLQVTVIQGCLRESEGTTGYYVCSSNIFTRKSIKVCQERQEQGVPLLLDNRILGITAIHSKEHCLFPQRIFTPIGPALSWIGTTVKNLGYEEYERDILVQQTSTIVTKFVLPETQTTPPYIRLGPLTPRISTMAETQVSVTPTAVRPYMEMGEPLFEEIVKPIARDNRQSKVNVTLKSPAPVMRIVNARQSKGAVVTGTTAITFIPLRTSPRKPQTSSLTTLEALESNNVTSRTRNASTNIMDWFNAKVKDNLKKSPPSFLIVGSPTLVPTHRTTLFVDLT